MFIKPVRFSGRKSAKLLTGGRSGRKFADSARRAKSVSDEAIASARASDPSIVRLNKRALSVGIDLSLRSTAAKGGLMAVQWLDKNRKKRKSATVKGGPIVMRSVKGIPLGMVEFTGADDSLTATLSGYVPGTSKQAARHGIITRVASARVNDRLKYILPRLEAAKKKALEKATH